MSVAEQAKVFAEADVIVATHGAALANLCFASPGSTVIELFAPDYVNVCYWALAQRVPGLRYRYLVGEGSPRRARRQKMDGVASDIQVDVGTLTRLLEDR
jgi:capsular polysaccharide biosynthesis protein